MSSTRDRGVTSISNFAIQDFGALPSSIERDAASIRLVMPPANERAASSAPSHDSASLAHSEAQSEQHRSSHGLAFENARHESADRSYAQPEAAKSAFTSSESAQSDHQVFADHATATLAASNGASAQSAFIAPAHGDMTIASATSFASGDMMGMVALEHGSRQGDFHFDASGHAGGHAPPPAGPIAGQLWFACVGLGSGNPDGHSDFRIMHADSDGLADDRIIHQEQVSAGIYQALGYDTSANLAFSLDSTFHLRVSNLTTGAILTNTVVASTADQDVMNCFVVNPDTNTIFAGLFGYDYLADGGDIIKITYNQTTGVISSPYSWNDTTHAFSINLNNVLIDSTSTGHVYADARSMYLSHDGATLYYTDDNNNDPGNFWGFSTNGVFKVSTTGSVGGGNAPTPVLLSSQAQFPVNDSNGYINGLAVDEGRGIIYFTTSSSSPGVNTSQNAIWWMPIAGGTATKMTIPGGVSVSYPVFFGDALEIDPKSHQLYYSDQVTGQIVQFTLSADGHSFSSATNFALFDTNHTSDGAYVNDMRFDVLPTLASLSATTTEAVQGGSAITLLTAVPSITDIDNLRLNNVTITITNAQSGDNLFCNGAQSGTQSGVTISWNASTHVLTLSGDVAFSTYQTLMSQISYQDSGVDNSTGSHPTRTINWTVSDGVSVTHASTADSNEQTTVVVIDRAPTLTADNYAVVETATVTGTSGTAGTGVLGNDNDKDADAIVVTAVQGSGGNVGNSVSGTYGHLTLNANGSYSYSADNAANIAAAANGSHPVDTFTYTVSDGLGGVTTSTVSFTIDRVPTVVADNPAGQALEGGVAITGNVLTNDSDRDGDTLTVSAVAGSGANVGNSIATTYGHMTINANGTYSFVADNTVAIDAAATGSHLTNTVSYTANDGHGGTTTTNIIVTIDRGPTVTADTGPTQAVEGSGFVAGNVLTNDSDRDGDTLTVSAVAGSAGNVAVNTATTYGHILIAANGGYSYSADNTVAIDAAATGSHLTDTVTYTASDGFGGTATTSLVITLDRGPTVVNDTNSAAESATVSKTAGTGLLANDSDRDGDSLTISAVAGAGGFVGVSIATTYGHITINADGSYSYTADNTTAIDAAPNGSHPVDTITFTVSDGFGGFTDATLSITLDRPAAATADSLNTFENSNAVNGSGGNANLLANDTDPDGDSFSITAVNGSGANVGVQILLASGALLTLNADGTYTYDPNHAFDYLPGSASGASNIVATDSFTYTITGGATVTVTINITGVDSNDTLVGTVGNDTMHGGIGDDVINTLAGIDTIFGDSGNDAIVMGANLTAADQIDGGTNIDHLVLDGDYSAGVTFNATTMVNVEFLSLTAGHDYKFTMNDGNVGAGQTLRIQAGTLGAGDSVTIDASAETNGNYIFMTGAGDDVLTGGGGNDKFRAGSGNETIDGGGGDDTTNLGAFFTAADKIDGGTGEDTLYLKGDYSAGVTFGAQTLTNVEVIALTAGHDYKLTLNAATVASGQTLTVRGGSLLGGDVITFDASALTGGGRVVVNAGAGDDVLTGGSSDDTFRVGAGADTVHGNGGNDTINAGSFLTATDTFDGGAGTDDTLLLDGDYSAGVTFGATTMTGIETMQLAAGHSYSFTMNAANVAAGAQLFIRADTMGAGDSFTFDGSAVTGGGTFNIHAGDGADTLIGGSGDDIMHGGNGINVMTGGGGSDTFYAGNDADQFVYNAVSDSTSSVYDRVRSFDANEDSFKITGVSVNAVDAAVTTGRLTVANFDSDLASAIGAGQLAAHDAVLFTADAGNLHGHTFLIVDVNGISGYQAGQDLVIEMLNGTHLNSLSAGNFFS